MKSPGVLKHFIIAFALALALYIVFFTFIEGRRTRNGPWRVAFGSAGSNSPPFLIINEPRLKISNVRVMFAGASAPRTNAVMIFDTPREVPFDVPLGQCVFMDLISQPGTVTFNLFGHEVQLIPRALTIDKKDVRWESDKTIAVPAAKE